MESNQGRVRDTDPKPGQPIRNEKDEGGERHEACYKPEMGTIVVTQYPRPLEP